MHDPSQSVDRWIAAVLESAPTLTAAQIEAIQRANRS